MGGCFNPLSVILKENKLIKPDYIDWKRNLNLVLTVEGYMFVLTEVCSPAPDSVSLKEEDKAYQKCVGFVDCKSCFSLVHGLVVCLYNKIDIITPYLCLACFIYIMLLSYM